MDHRECVDLIDSLRAMTAEREWFEFKRNNFNPTQIGENLSALANSACLAGRTHGYLIFGVDDETHTIVGTEFDPYTAKGQGNQELLIWLNLNLRPTVGLEPYIIEHPRGGKIVLFEISAARNQPIRFKGEEYVRIGSSTSKLQVWPEKERALWRIFDHTAFEVTIAAERVESTEVLQLLDYPAYFQLLEMPLPENRDRILTALAADKLITHCEAGRWNVTNLGAILFATTLNRFAGLRRKAMRVIQYRGDGRTETIKEQEGTKGYASGFEGLIGYINEILPSNEVIGQALRRTVPMFPELAVRELVANALIHQDFSATGAGPMVEIFDNRIEITNPGEPLVDTQRFLDMPPQSRNETLASLTRRFGICEERGSGIDKVVAQIELYQLPAPLFETPAGFTRATLFSHQFLNRMDRADRLRACYLHACLKYVMRDCLTNQSLRERFGIEPRNSATVSRYIRETVEAGYIRLYDEVAPRRLMKYVPFWA